MDIRVHKILPCTEVNGPGKRFGLWVQGCAGVPQVDGQVARCRGCWNARTWNAHGGKVVSVKEILALVRDAVQTHGIEGITFSGGEPFQQAEALAELAQRCREELGLNVIIFTGYTHEFLGSSAAPSGSGQLLARTDMLVDGSYVEELQQEDLPLRGSRNQRLVPLTDAGKKLADRVTDDLPVMEFSFFEGGAVVTGFPPQ